MRWFGSKKEKTPATALAPAEPRTQVPVAPPSVPPDATVVFLNDPPTVFAPSALPRSPLAGLSLDTVVIPQGGSPAFASFQKATVGAMDMAADATQIVGASPSPPGALLAPLAMEHRLRGRYEIIKPIGRGGFSYVYLARNTRDETLLAIKEACPPTGRRPPRGHRGRRSRRLPHGAQLPARRDAGAGAVPARKRGSCAGRVRGAGRLLSRDAVRAGRAA